MRCQHSYLLLVLLFSHYIFSSVLIGHWFLSFITPWTTSLKIQNSQTWQNMTFHFPRSGKCWGGSSMCVTTASLRIISDSWFVPDTHLTRSIPKGLHSISQINIITPSVFGAFVTKSCKNVPINFAMSICLYACYSSRTTARTFIKFYIGECY
jgi:hypothetical protein